MFVAFVLCSTVWELVKNNVDNYGFIDWKLCVVHQGSAMMSTIQYKCHILLYPIVFHMLHKSGISSFYLSRLVSFNKGWRVSRDSHPLVDVYIYTFAWPWHVLAFLTCNDTPMLSDNFDGESLVWCCDSHGAYPMCTKRSTQQVRWVSGMRCKSLVIFPMKTSFRTFIAGKIELLQNSMSKRIAWQ